jgi:hypothetical protein
MNAQARRSMTATSHKSAIRAMRAQGLLVVACIRIALPAPGEGVGPLVRMAEV